MLVLAPPWSCGAGEDWYLTEPGGSVKIRPYINPDDDYDLGIIYMSTARASYPVLQGQTEEAHEARRIGAPYPVSVPYDLVKDHEKQAQLNHSQSLSRLAERGGLSPKELWCVVHDTWFYDAREMTEAKAIDWLRSLEGVEWR